MRLAAHRAPHLRGANEILPSRRGARTITRGCSTGESETNVRTMLPPQHDHVMIKKSSRNDRRTRQCCTFSQQNGADSMNLKLLATAAAIAALTATTAQAQQTTAPGQKMQQRGTVSGSHGASGYAPGQQMHERGSVKGTVGASGYAPGHAGAGANGSATVHGAGAGGSAHIGGSAR
jgi:hypothetical protein